MDIERLAWKKPVCFPIRLSFVKRIISLFCLITVLPGCSWIYSSATDSFAKSLSVAILNQNNPNIVQMGIPAYLLLLDGFIEAEPENSELMLTASRLNGAYASAFVGNNNESAKKLTEKSWHFARRAQCEKLPDYCGIQSKSLSEYHEFLKKLDDSDVSFIYVFGTSWASWIQSYRDNWNAVADIPKVEATMQRVVEIDPSYQGGDAYLYLGVLSIILPPAMGGKPKQAQEYFLKAITISKGRNLMAKVLYAEKYGRMMFEKELHDSILQEVIDANPEAPGLTLMNTIAQQRAQVLLESSNDYF